MRLTDIVLSSDKEYVCLMTLHRDMPEKKVREIVFSNEHVLQRHGFYLTKETSSIRFDVVISFDAPDRRETYRKIISDVQKEFPGYQLQIALDTDFSE